MASYPALTTQQQQEVGLLNYTSHPVRVRCCLFADQGAVDYTDPEKWILELEPPFLQCKTNRLAFENAASWTPRLRLLLRLNVDAALLTQNQQRAAHANGEQHEPFRWFMYLTDFLAVFTDATVYHNHRASAIKILISVVCCSSQR
eukprot:m.395858 g.395858  ORF g.395858 m.395858 type:complete len:146 (+) comp56401_c0_seq8:457-894(+)